MGIQASFQVATLLTIFLVLSPIPQVNAATVTQNGTHQLLILMLDGFRWDYYDKQKDELPGFTAFLEAGVRPQWVEPLFPSMSYPSWTTIGNGLYPESHGILGNYIYDPDNDLIFSLDDNEGAKLEHWWQDAEPLWISATKQGKRAFCRYWNRCDVPFHGLLPEHPSGYESATGVPAIRETLRVGIESLKDGYDLVMIYGEHIDNVGHGYGPDSPEIHQAMREIDVVLAEFQKNMTEAGLDDQVNVVIVGDHGMTWVRHGETNFTHIVLDGYVNAGDVNKIMDRGPYMAITPAEGRSDELYDFLRRVKGLQVYQKENIPDFYRFKSHRLSPGILVVAEENYFVHGLQTPGQVPLDNPDIRRFGGIHGYANISDMNTVFFAKGPDFKKGVVHSPIHLVDEYQVFAHLLGISAQPNNGTWSKVSGMLSDSEDSKVCKRMHAC